MRSLPFVITLALLGPAHADEATPIDIDPVEVHGARDRDEESVEAARALDEPAFVTVIRLGDQHGEAPSTAEVLGESVGASVRSLGGAGSFTSISLRGAPSAQTEILIDGVPLSRVGSATIDVGSFDLATFDGVEIYRGGVPVALGGAALGGAVNFTTAVGPRSGQKPMTLSLAGGSFGARQARLVRRDRFGRAWVTTFGLGYAGATGDFEYFDDGGTTLTSRDDFYRARQNNHYDQADVVARTRYREAGLLVEGGTRLSWKQQGLPGLGLEETLEPTLATRRLLADTHVMKNGALGVDALDLGGSGHVVVELQDFRDPDGELGAAARHSSGRTLSLGLVGRASLAVSEQQLLSVALEPRLESYRTSDELQDRSPGTDLRLGAGLSLSDTLSLADDRLLLVPALRVDVLATRPADTMPLFGEAADARTYLEASPRLSARVTVLPGVVVKSSVGRYFRAPTMFELYGDRGLVVGNPSLVPETGLSADLGLVYAPAQGVGRFDRLFVEAAGFASRAEDLVVLVGGPGQPTQARNLDDVDLAGGELSASGRLWQRLSLTANYTYLRSRVSAARLSVDGTELPGRPRHELYARLDLRQPLGRWALGAHLDTSHQRGAFYDVGNGRATPPRTFLGAGLRLDAPRGLSFSLVGRNLTNKQVDHIPFRNPPVPDQTSYPQAVSDQLGYPLPGRSLMLSASADF